MYRFLTVCPKFCIFPSVLSFFSEDRLSGNALPRSSPQLGEAKEEHKYSEEVPSVPFHAYRRVSASHSPTVTLCYLPSFLTDRKLVSSGSIFP